MLNFLSSDESYLLDDESDDYVCDSGSAGMCALPFWFENYVGRVRDMVSGVFVTIGVESNYYVVLLAVFIPIGVESKGVRLNKIFWCPKS